MLKQSDINMEKVNQAMNSLKEMAEYDTGKNRLLVLGAGKGSVADMSISNSDKILNIKKEINNYILKDK